MPYIVTAMAIVAAVGAAVSAEEMHVAGVQAKNQDIVKSRQAGIDAQAKQIQIRQNMMQALASQNARAGAAGIGTGGSFGAGIQRQITQNQNDLLTNSTNVSTQQQLFGMAGASAEAQGNFQAGASLLDFAGSNSAKTLAGSFGGGGGGGGVTSVVTGPYSGGGT